MKKLISLAVAAMAACCFSQAWANDLMFESAVEHYNDGARAQKKGDLGQAFVEYQKAYIIFGPKKTDYSKFILNNTAVIYAQQGNMAAAEDLLLQAVAIDPKYKEANFNLGMLYAKKGQCMKALEYFIKTTNSPGDFLTEGEKELYPKPQLLPK